MAPFKLTYLNIRGRAELARLLFAVSNVDFYDNRLDYDDFLALKKAEKLPFDQLPVLEGDALGEMVLSQTYAIYHYLANVLGLLPDKAEDNAFGHMIIEHLRDIQDRVKCCFYPEFDKEKYEKEFEANLAPMFEKLQNLLAGKAEWIAGSRISLVDVIFFDAFNGFVKDDRIVDKFPELVSRHKSLMEVDGIKKWSEKSFPDTFDWDKITRSFSEGKLFRHPWNSDLAF
eukprot:TRINITY_DN9119_c0_g2_i1.p1 TRINITY_DN9119_c0_g2~~TRINITY_DN9119_c0_g2_i1.p1  ORF type:complete len:229 (+),score=68.05 TRINITY_DN9119_c0_g2_i1:62-748(+)